MTARCFKCNNDVAIVASREGQKKSYCRTCFLDIYHRNVRDTFFRQCRVPPDVPIILAVSGGINSMAMMHAMGLLRVQNITRGGAGKINFDMHVLHLSGDDTDDGSINGAETCSSSATGAEITKACTAIAPIDHVPQATTTKRRVKQQKQQAAADTTTTDGGAATTADHSTTPLFEHHRVHVKRFTDYLPPLASVDETMFGGALGLAKNNDNTTTKTTTVTGSSSSNGNSRKPTPLTSVSMAEDLMAQLRLKAIVAAAKDVAAAVWQTRDHHTTTGATAEGSVAAPANTTSGLNKHTNTTHAHGDYFLLLGDSAVHSSVEALYNIIRGRGQSIVEACGYRGTLFGGTVAVRRPLRGLLPKENLFYCRIEALPTRWTAAPYPNTSNANVGSDSTTTTTTQSAAGLLLYCIANATVHRDMAYRLAQSIKKHYAGTPRAVITHQQQSSVKQLLEGFVLNLSDGSYRSAIFNIIHSVDKVMSNVDGGEGGAKRGGVVAGAPLQSYQQQQQFRFGPKNAAAFASAPVDTTDGAAGPACAAEGNNSSQHQCALCGADGGNATGATPHSPSEEEAATKTQLSWYWCRSCRQVLRPLFGAAVGAHDDGDNRDNPTTNELMHFLTHSGHPLATTLGSATEDVAPPILKMTHAQIRAEISEFLLDNDDDV